MDLPVNHFKRAIASGESPIGAWLVSSAPSTVKHSDASARFSGRRNGAHTIDPRMVGIADDRGTRRRRSFAAVERYGVFKRALDAGAQSLLFPFVQNAEEAKRAVANTRYPPAGVRGVAAMHRGSRYGTVPNHAKRAHEEICVIVQIETLTAFEQLEAIAAVPGVDSIFIGPADLSASMGFLGDMGNPAVQEKLSAGAQTCFGLTTSKMPSSSSSARCTDRMRSKGERARDL